MFGISNPWKDGYRSRSSIGEHESARMVARESWEKRINIQTRWSMKNRQNDEGIFQGKSKKSAQIKAFGIQYISKNKNLLEKKYVVLLCELLVMEEILHHLRCIKPCKQWDKPINWFSPAVFHWKSEAFQLLKPASVPWSCRPVDRPDCPESKEVSVDKKGESQMNQKVWHFGPGEKKKAPFSYEIYKFQEFPLRKGMSILSLRVEASANSKLFTHTPLEWLEGSTLYQNTSRQGTGDCRPLGLSFPWQHTKNLENANTWLIQKGFIQPMVHGMFMGV